MMPGSNPSTRSLASPPLGTTRIEAKQVEVKTQIGKSEFKFSEQNFDANRIAKSLRAVKDVKSGRSRSGSTSSLLFSPTGQQANEDKGNISQKHEDSTTSAKIDVSLAVKADIDISGTDEKDVGLVTEKLANHIGYYLSEIGTLPTLAGYDPVESEKLLHKQFQKNVRNLLSSPNLGHGSINILDEFSSAEDLLAEGVDKYVQAVHSVLRTELDESISVIIEGLSYRVISPKIEPYEGGHNTVSRSLFRLLCGVCAVGWRAINNAIRKEPVFEFNQKVLLDNVTALIDPGRLTLVVGPPGCGKTTFLKAISGQLKSTTSMNQFSFGTLMDGELMFNGRRVRELRNLAAWVSYTGQNDEHQPLLTVKETLEFAFRCRKQAMYSDKQILGLVEQFSGQEAVDKLLMLKELEVEIALALLGLTSCKDTIIGHENLKGVSGGERRRVTLGEMLVTGSQIMCCDEISTGLDSAATFDIIAYLRSAAHVLKKSIIVALLQPAPEVIDLFDDVVVLADGRIIYHGPKDMIMTYFNTLGYKMIDGKDIGDFIVELPTRNGIDYLMTDKEIKTRGINPLKIPRTPRQFAESWWNSEMFQKELQELANRKHEHLSGITTTNYFDYDDMPERSFLRGMWDTLAWCMVLRLRDKIQIFARIVVNLLCGFFFGTLFWQLTLSDWWLKGMMFIMALMFLVSTAFPNAQVMSKQKGIFFKHITAKFYSPLQFTTSLFMVSIPFVAFDSAVFGASLYWMTGLASEPLAFGYFMAICISFGICMHSTMAVFPFITKDEDTGIVVAAMYLILTMIASGALSTESMIPSFFRWTMWINPLAWSYRGLAINEYHTEQYRHSPCKFSMIGINLTIFQNCSDYFLQVREVRSDDSYVPAAIGFNVLYNCIALFILTYAVAYIRFDTMKSESSVVPKSSLGNTTSEEKEDSSRRYRDDLYLSAVTPARTVNQPAKIGNGSIVEALQTATGMNFRLASDSPSNPPSELQEPLLNNDSSTITSEFDGGILPSLPETEKKTLIVNNLWFTIPIDGEPVDFLKGVSFVAKPYRLTGLMGSSGAGKTTLMDVISGRKTVGYSRGEILINGKLKTKSNHAEFIRYAGYVEQFGVHAPRATIRESLQFSATLRLNFELFAAAKQALGVQATWKDFRLMKKNFVENVLKLLELDDIADDLAGGLSMEQNKRLTLGVELVANPSIIFCDEPTSGLDARAAAIVMKVLWKTAKLGRTVICTVHQPSTAIFNFFDDLLLLKRGGEIVFAGELGENAKNLIKYFNGIPGTKPYKSGMNPATWMLEVIGAGVEYHGKVQVDFANYYNNSKLKKDNQRELNLLMESFRSKSGTGLLNQNEESQDKMQRNPPLVSPFRPAGSTGEARYWVTNIWTRIPYNRSQLSQTWLLLLRSLTTYWRSPEFSLNRLLIVMLFTMIFSVFFYDSQLKTVADLEGRIINIFFYAALTCIYNLYTLVPFALSRRALYYRERAQGMYSVLAFSLAESLVELPWLLIQVIMTVPLLYYLTNLNSVSYLPFVYFALMIYLNLIMMTSIGYLSASLFPDALAAQLAAVLVLIVQMLFSGTLVPLNRLPKPYVPLYYLSFFKYSSEGLLTTQFHDLGAKVCLPSGVPWVESKPSVIIDTLHWLHEHISKDFPEDFCTMDGNLTIDPYNFDATMKSIRNVTGILTDAEDFVLGHFLKDFDYNNCWIDVGMLAVWVVILRLSAYFVMSCINHQRR